MDFSEGSEIRGIREAVRDLTRRFPADYWLGKDQTHEFPSEFWKALGEAGWLGVVIPAEYGGAGLGALEMAAVVEEVSAGGAGATGGLLFILHSVFGALSIVKHGSEEQKRRWLPRLATGEIEFSMALTEPDAGSNTPAIRTMARPLEGGYELTGSKVFITNIDRAAGCLVVCRTTPYEQARRKNEGLSLFILENPAETPGVSFSPLPKLGCHSYRTHQVWFDRVRLPKEALLGQEGRGWEQILDVLNAERIVATATALGLGDLALRTAVEYARERVVFDRPIGSYQGLAFPLAEIKAELEAARLLNYKAAWLFDHGQPCGAEVNMAKYLATEACWRGCDWAVQVHGGYGYIVDYHVERYLREARVLRIAPVSSQMVLNYIAQHVLGLPRSY